MIWFYRIQLIDKAEAGLGPWEKKKNDMIVNEYRWTQVQILSAKYAENI